jgi:dihydroflavonol-4-reductase
VNPVTFPLERGDRVVVTGAAGFIGSAVTRALLHQGAEVVAIVEPGAAHGNLRDLRITRVDADITSRDDLEGAFDGARYCFHLAARYGFWPRDPDVYYRVNVDGSRNVVHAAVTAGVERVCYTSSVATLGLWKTKQGVPSREDDYADVAHLFGNYKQTKYVAEHEILRLAAEGAPVVIVQPTMPHGPFDHRPTPSGKLVLDYLNGKIPGFVNTAMNVAHVDDLATGHLLALQRGRQGRSYICGGENLTMNQILIHLADVTGLPRATRSFPSAFPLWAARASEFVEGSLLQREPRVSRESARMSTTTMTFSDARAREELGYDSRPARHALFDSAQWFVENGYVSDERRRALRWSPPRDS